MSFLTESSHLFVSTLYVDTYICFVNIESAIKQPKFKSEYHKLIVNVLYTSSWIDVRHQQFMKGYGITMQQFNILRILRGQKGNPLSINSLIERMIDKSSNASRLVDKLVEKEYVDRQVCPNDRRQAEVRITEKGMALLAEMDGPISSLDELARTLTEEEAKQLNHLLDKLRTNQ